MSDKRNQNEVWTEQRNNTVELEEHSMLCNENLFFAGLRAAAEDTDRDDFGEEQ